MKDQTEDHNSEAFSKLLQLGFEESHIRQALSLTSDIQIASQIALKLADEGPHADLSEYLPAKKQPEYPSISLFSRAKMLFIVNAQLKMGKGKICAQVGHAVIGTYLQIQQDAQLNAKNRARLENWENVGTPKVVVRCDTEKEMLEIKAKLQELGIGINTYLVEDAGHTQIKAGSKTVLGVGPAFPQQIDPITKHLKLL